MNTLRTLILPLTLFALVLATLPASAEDAPAAAGQVNINTADRDQLALLPRVGPVVAQRIIDFREENGKFASPEDLILVPGIGEKTYALLEPHVVVSGETTLKDKVRLSRSSGSEGSQ